MLTLPRSCRARRGASLISYGLLTGLISVAAIGAVSELGGTVAKDMSDTSDEIAAFALAETGPGTTGAGGGSDPDPAVPDCYDPANAGSVGEPGWTDCAGMLIVDTATLRAAGSDGFRGSGDGSYAIEHDGTSYTFADSAANVFTGQVTDMSYLFSGGYSFDGDIGYWDTGAVTNMAYMFHNMQAFDQDIGGWDTSSVTDMRYMFFDGEVFDQDIGDWDTSQVSNMSHMFHRTEAFNQDLSGWCVSGFERKASYFDADATRWTGGAGTRPRWGRCPTN